MLIVLGYLIAVKKKMALIAGYSEKQVNDKQGLAKLVGYFTIAIGIVTAIMPILLEIMGEYAIWIFSAIVIGGSVIVVIKAQKY